jgi:PAS domain S-box-containing protein
LRNASNFPHIRIDKSSLLIAAIAPLLWIVDSYRSAIFLNESFLKQLFFPETSALFLRLWLVFFILVQTWFFNRFSRTQNRVFEIEKKLKSLFDLAPDALVVIDIEGKVVEASDKAARLWGYSLKELSALDLTRLCAANESERLINFIREIIKNKTSGLDNVMLAVKDSLTIPADIKGILIDNLDVQDKPGIFLDITGRKNIEKTADAVVVAPEITVKKSEAAIPAAKPEPEVLQVNPEQIRSRIEDAIRKEEAEKSREALKNLEQKYLELMRVRLAEESKKAEERIRELESKVSGSSQGIEEAIKQEQEKKLQEQTDVLEHKYNEILNARVAEARQQAEELISQEVKTKFEEQLRAAEAKFASESGAKISEGRKLIEDSVRQEEQRKAEESAAALKQKYEELLRQGIEDERKRGEEATKLERGRIEAVVRKEEQEKALQAINELKLKYEEALPKAIAEERKRGEEATRRERRLLEEALRSNEEAAKQQRSQLEEALRKEEKKRREDELRAFEVKYAEAAGIKMSEERGRVEAAVRKEEQEKAQQAINELKLKHEELLSEAIDEERKRGQDSIKKAEASVKAAELKSQSKQPQLPEIGKLVSGVGQQMLNPLGAVLNYLKVIKIKLTQGSELKPQEFKDTINLIEENALLCKNILSSLADPSKVAKTTFQPVSLNEVIAKIDSLLGQELRLQNITVSKALQSNLPNIFGDPLLLTQVVFNLISNAKLAIKNNPYAGGGTLIIKTQPGSKNSVELIITDNGAGIPENNLPRIFEPFFTTKPDGLGLGLTIAESIVKEHKGEIQVESKEGIGSTFKVIFPALKEE